MQMVKVVGLMTGLTVLLVGFGSYLGGSQGAVLFLVIAAVMNFGMYWFSDRAVLKMYRARILRPEDAPDLYRMVDRLRQGAGLPMPTLALAPSEQPNAFATGRNPAHAVVCVTAGIVRLLPPRELEGVIAHELAHIKHRHMLVGTVAATMAGAVAMLASVARWGMIFGMGGRDDRGQNPLGLLVMAIVAPLAAMIVQLAISRQNEFQADATAAGLTRDPRGLASALQRIEGYASKIPMPVNPAAAQLAIINPLRGGHAPALAGLFRTHPPTEERVARLNELQV
ncbi:MAG TPA: zinc metalloprotease HtpX [Longimicrobiales bacterium]|nr:zinc metalloprotease HtpX [Longimicrobiales bacterium]